jgi:hypothetical protein
VQQNLPFEAWNLLTIVFQNFSPLTLIVYCGFMVRLGHKLPKLYLTCFLDDAATSKVGEGRA